MPCAEAHNGIITLLPPDLSGYEVGGEWCFSIGGLAGTWRVTQLHLRISATTETRSRPWPPTLSEYTQDKTTLLVGRSSE